MQLAEILVTVAVGVLLVLLTPPLLRQRDRLWGPGRDARAERVAALRDEPTKLVLWAIREGLIILWCTVSGVLILAFAMSFFIIDHIRGVPPDHFAYVVFIMLVGAGAFLGYVGIRGASQVIEVLDHDESMP